MAVKLRLKRIGRRKRPFYRIVAIDSRSRRDGAEIERLGWYDPLRTDVAVEVHEERIIHWLKRGAEPSETVSNILREIGLKYKMHLIGEGKSEEQIASLLTEWQLRQEEKRAKQLEKKEAKKQATSKAKEAEIAAAASTAADNIPSDDKILPATEEAPVEDAEEKAEESVEAKAEESEEAATEAPAEDTETVSKVKSQKDFDQDSKEERS